MWITRRDHSILHKNGQLLTLDGITDSVEATAKRIGITASTLHQWIKRGDSPEAISERVKNPPPKSLIGKRYLAYHETSESFWGIANQYMPPEALDRLMAELKAWFKDHHGEQKKLAAELQITEALLSNWLARRKDPGLKNYLKLQAFAKKHRIGPKKR